jgi:diguanylate cyclase (GGDEF)-like protein
MDTLIMERGNVFYSDLFYVLSHRYYPPEVAQSLWGEILRHKHIMSERLQRNVRVAVAALDYLSNITGELESPTLISETDISHLTHLSLHDGMTGLYNHSTCFELLELEFRSHRRYGAGVSLILLDIDDFKLINDQYGHQEGDRVLIELARTLTQQVRDSDICCRYGGEEFVAILPFTSSLAEACGIAERIRQGASDIVSGEKGITVSLGVAACVASTLSPQDLMESADHALYRAKRAGKNRVARADAWGQ